MASFEYKIRRISGVSRCLHPSLLCSEVDFSKAHTGLFIVRFYLESADGSTKILPFEFIADGDPLQNRDHFVERVMRARTAVLTAALTITPAPVPTQPTSSCAVEGVVATSSHHVRYPIIIDSLPVAFSTLVSLTPLPSAPLVLSSAPFPATSAANSVPTASLTYQSTSPTQDL